MFHGLPEMVEYLSLRNRSEFPRSVNPTTGVNRPRPGRCFGRLPLTSNAGIGPVFYCAGARRRTPQRQCPQRSSRRGRCIASDPRETGEVWQETYGPVGRSPLEGNVGMPVRVVIAEDEWLIAAALRRQVEACGCDVLAAVGTGARAVTAACSEHPDLVLMDVQMPEMDGLEATRRLMEQSPTCVVIVTGKAKQEEAAEQAGAMDCIMKPLLSGQIPALVENARRRFMRFAALDRDERCHEEALQAWAALRRAVRALMESDGLTEDQAFDRLEAEARDRSTLAEALA